MHKTATEFTFPHADRILHYREYDNLQYNLYEGTSDTNPTCYTS